MKRSFPIDILKCLGVIFITNSHMGSLWHPYEFLATGAIFGNALFFFCSGFTLSCGVSTRFGDWYGRRYARIFPSVLCAALVSAIASGTDGSLLGAITLKSGWWFVRTIMLFYIIFWAIGFIFNKFPRTKGFSYRGGLILSVAITIVWFLCLDWSSPEFTLVNNSNDIGLECYNRAKYFMMMMLGSYVGECKRSGYDSFAWLRPSWSGLLAGVTLMLYFIAAHGKGIIQGFAIILAAMFVFCLYRFLEGSVGRLIEDIRPIRTAVLVVAGLSLEVYLSQGYITDKFNFLFPLNLPIVFLIVLFMAYLTRIIARTFTMTMQNTRSHRYDWRKVFSIV